MSKHDLNCTVVLPSNKIGGGNRVLVCIAEQTSLNGGKASIFYIEHENGLLQLTDTQNTKIRSRNESLSAFILAAISLSKAIRMNKSVTTVIVSDPILSIFSFIYRNKRVVRYVQSDDYMLFDCNPKAGPLAKRGYRLLFLISQRYKYHSVIFNSRFSQRSYLRTHRGCKHKDEKYIIHPPVFTAHCNAARAAPPPKNGPRICVVTSAHIRKGFDYLTQIIEQTTHKNARFLVVSQDTFDYTHPAISYAKPRDDGEYVQCLNSCSIILNTSRFEGFGLPLLEGMAFGLVPISVKHEGLEEYHSGNNILLIDGVSDFDHAISALTCENTYKKASQLAINTAKRFDVDTFFGKIKKILE